MKLSEAMTKGMERVGHGRREWLQFSYPDNKILACALVTIWIGATEPDDERLIYLTEIKGPDYGTILDGIWHACDIRVDEHEIAEHPIAAANDNLAIPATLEDILMDLNDEFGWEREEIRDWLIAQGL